MSRHIRFLSRQVKYWPAALQIFPRLKLYAGFWPRRLKDVPIGNRGRIDGGDRQICLRHLYHDLGVLVFEGATPDQVRRIGDIISRVVSSGGLARLATTADWRSETETLRIEPPGDEDIFESIEAEHAGVLKPNAIYRIADVAIRAQIAKRLSQTQAIDPSSIQIRDTNVEIRKLPDGAKGVTHPTVSGLRTLPLDVYTTVKVYRDNGNVTGQVRLYTGGGMGGLVGLCVMNYSVFRVNKDKGIMKPVLKRDPIIQGPALRDEAKGRKATRQTQDLIDGDILNQLFRLEDEIWAERADQLVQYSSGVALDYWQSKGLRPPPQRVEGLGQDDLIAEHSAEEGLDVEKDMSADSSLDERQGV